jgi:hypothetical protein
MDKDIKVFVGLDVHKDSIAVAVAEQGRLAARLDVHKDSIAVAVAEQGRLAARLVGTIGHDVAKLCKVLARLGKVGEVHVVYEAGPTG